MHLGALARRSIVRTLRQPLVWGPTLLFPLFFFAVIAPSLQASTDIEGFPTDSYITFALAMPFVQAGLSGCEVAGGALAEDIRTGFLSRLSLTPLKAGALLIGSLAGALALAAIGAIVYLAVGLAAGAEIETGVPGAVVVILLSVLFALGFASLGVFVALRAPTPDAVQALYPLLLALFFLSTMVMPLDLIETDWFKAVATYNPLSYLVDAVRSLLITGWEVADIAKGCAVAVVMTVLFLGAAGTQVGARLTRT